MNRPSRLFRGLRMLPLAAMIAAAGCASIGNPSGGPRDEEPPRAVRTSPTPGATNFSGNEVNIWFDELISVKDAFQRVTVSPPSARTPRVSGIGRRVNVRFEDTLKPNTTYTIDFGNAIEDNNEGNALENFTYSFSTGPVLDSLRISGIVLGAFDLEPLQRKLVGVYSTESGGDTLFRRRRFERVARTDDRGRFTIYGLSPGRYRIFALDDADADMRYSSPEEVIAFYDALISPSTRPAIAIDTIFDLKTGKVDTVVERGRTRFLPDDILLRSFTSGFKQQYLSKYERLDTTRLQFTFNSRSVTPPQFSIVGAPGLTGWMTEERTPGNDTVTLWLRSRGLIKADTLMVAARYERTDSAMRPVTVSDTLRLTFDRKGHERALAQKEKELRKQLKTAEDSLKYFSENAPRLEINVLSRSQQEVNLPLLLETGAPLARLDSNRVRLAIKKDSIWADLGPVTLLQPDSLQPRRFAIEYPWQYGMQYRLTADSAAMEGIYGRVNRQLNHEFRIPEENDYSSLRLRLKGLDAGMPAFVEVLSSDNPVASAIVENGTVVFPYLHPGQYYVRVYEDYNGNGVWDPGDFDKGLQPEVVYYYPKKISLKKNWSKDETWDVFAVEVDKQKPEAILKNRPDMKKGSRNSRPEEEPDEEEDM